MNGLVHLDLDAWIVAARLLGATAATLLVAWALGHLLNAVIVRRLPRWLSVEQHAWIATAVRVLRRRLPMWSILVGIWIAASYWPLTPQARVLVGQVVFVLGAGSATVSAATIVTDLVEAYGQKVTRTLPVTSLTRSVAWSAVAVIGLLMILNGLGLSIAPMLTALGVGGLAVALALQEPLSNFFAGLFIALAGQIRVGDYLKLDSGQEGYVVDFSWRSTRLRMLSNNLVLVPNGKLAAAVVVNHHLPSDDLAVLVEVGVDYASDLARVERVVCEVGREVMTDVSGGVTAFEPFVRYHSFGDSSVNFTTILRAREFVDQYLVKHEFVKRLHARFAQEGIVIPFPIRTIVGRDVGGDA